VLRRHRLLRAILLTFALATLATPASANAANCASPSTPGGDWPSYGHDLANTRSQPSETLLSAARLPQLSAAWVFSTASVGDSAGIFNSTPVVANGCVFAGSAGGYVYALNQATGAPLWVRKLDVPSPGLGGAIVGAPAVAGGRVYVPVNQTGGPYAVALDEHTGAVVWRSLPLTTYPGSYTNASVALFRGLLFLGFSPPEGDPAGQGGWALLDTATGTIVNVTNTIPPADQLKGYAGGGIWSTPAFDGGGGGYAFIGAGNPSSKTMEHPFTNSILKIDMDQSRLTFGQVVAHYKGNPDQYTNTLETLSQTPVCAASDNPSVSYPLDDPACGQLDLDFGAAPNLFTDASGHPLVGDLQKAGVEHAAHADTMAADWSTLVGLSCQACNAASAAYDGRAIYGAASPGATEYALDRSTGAPLWQAPLGDGTHYQSTSVANGVVYTIDGNGFLDAFDAVSGSVLLQRPMSSDTGSATGGLTSGGIAIADHTLFVATAQAPANGTPGFLVAYR
jgi:polyvinyl alcohol dehydrogenase (cytochrome)